MAAPTIYDFQQLAPAFNIKYMVIIIHWSLYYNDYITVKEGSIQNAEYCRQIPKSGLRKF